MKKIGFKNFKRFADCPVLDLSGITFLVGKNNAGKTTFTHAARLAANFINQTSKGGNLNSLFSFEIGSSSGNRYRGYNSVLHRGSNNGLIEFRVDYGEFVLDFGIDKKYNPFGFIEEQILDWVYDSYYSQYPEAETDPEIDKEWLNNEVEQRMTRFQKDYPDRYKRLLEEDKEGKGEISYIHFYDKTNRISGLLEAGKTKLVFYDFPEEVGEEHLKLTQLVNTLPEEDRPTVQERIDELAAIIDSSQTEISREGIISKGLEKKPGQTLPEFYSIDCLAENCLTGNKAYSDDGMPYDRIAAYLNEGDHRSRLESFKELFSKRVYHQMPSCACHISHYSDSISSLFGRVREQEIEDSISHLFRRVRNEGVHGEAVLMNCITKWVKEFEIGDGIRIHRVSDESESVFECSIEKTAKINGKDQMYEVPFDSLGVGSRQLIVLLMNMALVITQAARKSYPTLVTIEEPEQNLHPAIQSKLADMFLDFYNQFGCQCIVETHSEYIIRRAQVLVAEGIRKKAFSLEDNPFKVYYFPDDDSSPYDMTFKENGRFERSFGSGFVDVAGESNLALLDLATLFDLKK